MFIGCTLIWLSVSRCLTSVNDLSFWRSVRQQAGQAFEAENKGQRAICMCWRFA